MRQLGQRHAALRPLCIAGPTASGKSAVAMAIAQAVPAEIVSVDSALVYRGMDIGTAKPTAQERQAVPHHLIDIREPDDAYSAAEFVRDATRLIGEIAERGRLPLLVGGTMLYFVALFEGLDALPPADPQVRRELDREAAARGWPALHAELARIDPATAARLAPTDAQRIQRAIEVFRLTGRPLSTLHRGSLGAGSAPWPLIALEPQERVWLHARIAERFDGMLERGFVEEVRSLMKRPDLNAGLPALRSVGYRQAWALLEASGGGPLDAAALQRLRGEAVAATRQLAKRQLTWLRRFAGRTIVACDRQDATQRAVECAVVHWSRCHPPAPPRSRDDPVA